MKVCNYPESGVTEAQSKSHAVGIIFLHVSDSIKIMATEIGRILHYLISHLRNRKLCLNKVGVDTTKITTKSTIS